MTVQELRDKLDHYIKHDIGDVCMFNDVDLDRWSYEDRCNARANHQVIFCDDGMDPKHYSISAFGSTISREVSPAIVSMSKQKVTVKTLGIPGSVHEEEKEVPVQVKPPEYEPQDVFMIIPKDPVK